MWSLIADLVLPPLAALAGKPTGLVVCGRGWQARFCLRWAQGTVAWRHLEPLRVSAWIDTGWHLEQIHYRGGATAEEVGRWDLMRLGECPASRSFEEVCDHGDRLIAASRSEEKSDE